ncbi:OFA family MFS transporter [Terribacillus sp. DMT04]|uniref:L-lactate MFS transporter n=1 Tax=Terribacillus sp. DMT04 TaxID=2850441 RepID=UPI001C2BDF71|nr:OFA family MFS transporter [Terribacillus sp. DMT04]QXE01589.1 OFA family MFS transporter [Terribacillus sp. DMT04]
MKTETNRWLIVLGTIITQIGLGTIYTWSLFNQPLADAYGWSTSAVAVTFSITSFALAIATLFGGKLQDKLGIKKLVICAGILLGAGLMLSSLASSLWLIYLLAGVVVGFANGIAYITTLSNVIKWFPEKKGLISGISVGAFGTGSLVFKYINQSLLASAGVQGTFLIWGIAALILISGGAFLLKDASPQETTASATQKNFTVKEMLKTKQAYILFVIFLTACMSGLYLIGIVKDAGMELANLSAATAANAVAIVAICNTTGRVVLGALSDKVERLYLVAAGLFVTAGAVAVLSLVELSTSLFFVCVAAVAFFFGGNITVFPTIVADYFGLQNQGKNYGVIYQGFGIGALGGSFIATLLGGFQPTFVAISILCVISFFLAVTVRSPQQPAAVKKQRERQNTRAVPSQQH